MDGFEPVARPRFRVESREGSERIVIPAARNWFILPFLAFWLVMWTIAGIAVMTEALRAEGSGFLLIWLLGWAIGWLFAASWMAWQVSGREVLAVEGGALVRRWSIFNWGREKRYDLSHVEDLSTSTPAFPFGTMRMSYPPFFPVPVGPLKWNYGAATIYAAAGLSEAEAKMIAVRLRSRFPVSARG